MRPRPTAEPADLRLHDLEAGIERLLVNVVEVYFFVRDDAREALAILRHEQLVKIGLRRSVLQLSIKPFATFCRAKVVPGLTVAARVRNDDETFT